LAILREGSEAVLFLFGVATSDGASAQSVASGAALGLMGGIASGAALYLGLLRIPQKLLFSVTGWLIILLAAGMASQAAAFLVQAGQLPCLVDELWDSSQWLPRGSVIGQLLHILIGYDDRPAGIQLAFYFTTVIAILGLSQWTTAAPPKLTISESLHP
jgi:high-affinity iron transporter